MQKAFMCSMRFKRKHCVHRNLIWKGQKRIMPKCNRKEKHSCEELLVQESSGNVFSDLGYTEAESVNIVARLQLMLQIEDIIKDRGWTQEQAAKILGLRQPRVSELLSSRSDKFTVDMLMKLLDRLGKKVVLTVENKVDVA
jgi:predicted XRE-type DNA-binding protein